MIYIGFENQDKKIIVNQYRQEHNITNTVVIYSDRVPKAEYDNVEYVSYDDAIEYVYFYRLLQEVNNDTLIVIDECLRTQNRYELNYNCIRHFLAQAKHQIIFQRLPQIDERDDFMILFDFDTQSRWKGRKFDINLILDNSQVVVKKREIAFNAIRITTTERTKKIYQKRREECFSAIGARDPHTLPRNLYQIGGQDKLAYIQQHSSTCQLSLFDDIGNVNSVYVARNQRLRDESIITYHSLEKTNKPIVLVEFPHRFIDFSDFISKANQYAFSVLVADLKVDTWYWGKYRDWSARVNETITSLSQR